MLTWRSCSWCGGSGIGNRSFCTPTLLPEAGLLHCAGCDALAVHLVVTTLAATISGGFSWQTVAGHMAIMGPWAAAHWEEYHTGVMLYGNGYWGVTEANYLMVAVHLATAVAGPGATLAPALAGCKLP